MDHPLLRGVEVWDVAGIGDDNAHLEENAADQTTADASHFMIMLFLLILLPATMVRSSTEPDGERIIRLLEPCCVKVWTGVDCHAR